jgi:hypothetical protein
MEWKDALTNKAWRVGAANGPEANPTRVVGRWNRVIFLIAVTIEALHGARTLEPRTPADPDDHPKRRQGAYALERRKHCGVWHQNRKVSPDRAGGGALWRLLRV